MQKSSILILWLCFFRVATDLPSGQCERRRSRPVWGARVGSQSLPAAVLLHWQGAAGHVRLTNQSMNESILSVHDSTGSVSFSRTPHSVWTEWMWPSTSQIAWSSRPAATNTTVLIHLCPICTKESPLQDPCYVYILYKRSLLGVGKPNNFYYAIIVHLLTCICMWSSQQ